jgi:cytochrome P450
MSEASPSVVRIQDAPMQHDRTAGWKFFRDAGDVFRDELGVWYVTGRDLIQTALTQPKVFSSQHAFDVSGAPVPMIPVGSDPPDHVRYRRALDPLFSPRVIGPMEDDLRRQVAVLIDAFADKDGCDVMSDLANIFPPQVFLTMFGMPLEDRDQLVAWITTIQNETNLQAPGVLSDKMVATSKAVVEYLQSIMEKKRANPGEDVFSRILSLSGEDAWSEEELLGFAYLFMIAGLDTVAATIGHVMHYLATHPDVRRGVVADPESVNPVVEEIIRMETVAPLLPRITTQDVELGGFTIPAGSFVVLAFGAANRDPRRYPNPDEVDISQADIGHLTFGGGIHRCVGSHLARRELRLVVDEFHKRIPEYELAPGTTPVVAWPTTTMRFESLPLVFLR